MPRRTSRQRKATTQAATQVTKQPQRQESRSLGEAHEQEAMGGGSGAGGCGGEDRRHRPRSQADGPVAAPARASLPGGDPADRSLASPQGRRPRAAATCPAARRSGGGRTSVGARSGSWHRRVPPTSPHPARGGQTGLGPPAAAPPGQPPAPQQARQRRANPPAARRRHVERNGFHERNLI